MAEFIGSQFDDVITPGVLSSQVIARPGGSRPSGAADTLSGDDGDDVMDGGGGNDNLSGGDGGDILQGGTGADRMEGGASYDTYYVDNSGDRVIETAASDPEENEINTTVSFTMPAFVGWMYLGGNGNINGTGNSAFNGIFGNARNNVIKGLGGDDWLSGQGGNDTVNGGAGADFMEGGSGNDSFILDNQFDVVLEYPGEGTDTVRSSVTFDDADDEIEIIVLTGSKAVNAIGGGGANTITGNNAANTLDGRLGNDTISGLSGADTLLGGGGDDTLRGGNNDDFLRGLTGRDVLIGGSGRDTFGYTNADQSTQAQRDIVRAGDGATAFQGAGNGNGDRFDLLAVDADTTVGGNQDFIFDGTTGRGHLWLVNSGNLTLIRGNVDGDNGIEFEVAVEDGSVLASDYTQADFLGLV